METKEMKVFTEDFFAELERKFSSYKQFVIEFRYNPQTQELLSFSLERENKKSSLIKHYDGIELIKTIEEDGELKVIDRRKNKNTKFEDDSLSKIREAIEELKSQHQCVEGHIFPEESGKILVERYTFSINYQHLMESVFD